MVPAVAGRILRMPGGAVHAVPRPAGRWLLSEGEVEEVRREEEEGERGEEEEDEEEDYDEEDEDYDDDDEEEEGGRAVILFNTWIDPPSGIDGDYAAPSGIEISGDFMEEERRVREEEWKEEFPEGVGCVDRSEWTREEVIETGQSGERVQLRARLMGNLERRGVERVEVRLRGEVGGALGEEERVTLLRMTEEEHQP